MSLLLARQHVVVAGRRDVGDHHAVFDALLEIDVLVERDVRPVVDELDLRVRRADTVDAAEALDDADRVPVDVVVDQIVAILKVLAFGDAVRADEDVDLAGLVRQDQMLFLRPRREQREQGLEVVALLQRALRASEPVTMPQCRPCDWRKVRRQVGRRGSSPCPQRP